MENDHVQRIYPSNMMIFQSHVSLPEGNPNAINLRRDVDGVHGIGATPLFRKKSRQLGFEKKQELMS